MKAVVCLSLAALLLAGCVGDNYNGGKPWIKEAPQNYGTNSRVKQARLSLPQRASVSPTNRIRCTTNCPPPRTNVVIGWNGTPLFWGSSVAFQGATITNYSIQWGPTATQTTNRFDVGLNLFGFLTNCPPGSNWVAVTATDSRGLESDPSVAIRLNVFRDWILRDAITKSTWQRATGYSLIVSLPAPNRLLECIGTNQATKQFSAPVRMAIR